MNHWLTTILIFLPVAGALLVAVAPLPGYWLGSLAALISLVEIGFWISAAARFDFGDPRLQFQQRHAWFDDLGVSYHVGQYAFSLWLVGATVVVMAACVIYGWWAGRDRARAYFSLMLLLTGAIVGVFTAQDLLLFYAFFEAMLIPLYVLIGVWGGPQRLRATLTFVIYTVVGSLLMLASIVVFGLQQGTFDLTRMGTLVSTWLFLGFVAAFAIKSPLFPFHGWLPITYRESPPEVSAVLSGIVSKAGLYGLLRIAIPKFPDVVDDWRVVLLVLASISLVYGSLLAFRAPDFRGVVLYSSLAQSGLIALGLFANNDLGYDGAVLQMVNHALISATLFLIAGMVERRTSTGEFRAARRHGARPAGARDARADDRRHLARRAALDLVRRRVPDPRGRLPAGLGLGRRRRRGDRAGGDVHAARDLRRAAPGRRAGGAGLRARPAARRARGRRAARPLPARALGLSEPDLRPCVRREPRGGAGRRRARRLRRQVTIRSTVGCITMSASNPCVEPSP